jgi:general secretion pathway protein D
MTLCGRSNRAARRQTRAAVAAFGIGILSACASTPADTAAKPTPAPARPPNPAPLEAPTAASAPVTTPESPSARAPTLLFGTGQFVGQPADKTPPSPDDNKGIQLTFVDTDIRSVLSAVLGDGLGLNYSIDPSIKGTITVQTSRPLPKDELLQALEAALSLQDIALVAHDGSYDVVPMKDAHRKVGGVRLPASASQPGFGVQIVPLRYTSAEEMGKLLEPFAPAGAIVRTDNARNLLVLAGTGSEIRSLLEVVQTFDVDWLAGMSYAFFPVDYVDAKTITEELKQVFDDQKSPMSGIVRLIPLTRLNTILVASPQGEYLPRVGEWIKRLDLGNSSPGRRIFVYDVQNGKASDLAITLNQILGISEAGAYSTGSNSAAASSSLNGAGTFNSQGSGSGLSTNGLSSFANRGSASSFTGNGYSNGNIQTTPYDASSATTQGRQYSNNGSGSGAGGAAGSLESAGLRIVPDESTNALLILATPTEFGSIDTAIKRLDVPPRQVLIEASLAEVTLTDEIKFGVEWYLKSSIHSGILTSEGTGTIASQFPGFSYLYSGASGFGAVLNALETITKVKVLSAPRLLVLNNHEADINIGDQVPILTQQAVSVGQTNAPIVNSVAQRDTGVILHVTPRVNQSGMVIMDISQEVSSVIPTTTSNINSPTIQERKISSTVAVGDGETIALGGLISETKSNDSSGLPWIQRIPVIGWLFGAKDISKNRTELIILIKPRVIRDPSELQRVMDNLHEEFRSVEQQTSNNDQTAKPAKP